MDTSTDRSLLARLGCIEFEAEFESFHILEISDAVSDILGYDAPECAESGFLLERLIHPDDVEPAATRIMELFDGGRAEFSFRAVRSDGSIVTLQALLTTRELGPTEIPRFGGLLFERQAETESDRRSEDRLQLALESADMGVWDWRLTEWSIFWSDEVYGLHGTTAEEVGDLFDNYHAILDRIHPKDQQRAQRTILEALRTGEDYELEYRVELPDESTRWLFVIGRIYFDEDDQPMRIAGTAQDITIRKNAEIAAQRELVERRRAEAELKKLTETLEKRVRQRTEELQRSNERLQKEVHDRTWAEQKLARANRRLIDSNQELQDFAFVASHDLREPLRKIRTFADLLESDHGKDLGDEGSFLLERLRHSAYRMTQLIDGVLQFSRVKTGGKPFVDTDLSKVADEVLADLELQIEDVGATVYVGSLPTVEADPTQMRQLFQNLISNALKFRRESVPPVVEIDARPLEAGETMDADGCAYQLTISDNGIGFEEQYGERIFSPFQRLRRDYEGTGMGLAICRRIMARHRGRITVHSTPGVGTAFQCDLPRRQAESELTEETA